eukprot:TRINITY_DN16967_c0_g1_i1.p1 TRINITY_DN16967_c0_g1~~TRINITY_DN16967_c0_g1_i1.p1  ORF type:complete len:800 (+),score=154.35 TRINITY_DN16967_c0_g1_i1:52-2451(+)
MTSLNELFLNPTASFESYTESYKKDPAKFKSTALLLLETTDMSAEHRGKLLFLSFHLKDYAFSETMLYHRKVEFGDVYSLMKGMDLKRRERSWGRTEGLIKTKHTMHKKTNVVYDLKQLIQEYKSSTEASTPVHTGKRPAPSRTAAPPAKKRRVETVQSCDQPKWLQRRIKKLAKLEKDLKEIKEQILPFFNATLSGNTCKRLRAWAESLSKETLEAYLLDFGLCLWKEFADLVHLNPSRMSIPSFLPCIYDLKKPRPVSVEYCMKLTKDDLEDIATLKKQKPSLAYLSKRFKLGGLEKPVKLALAENADITTLLRRYTQLATEDVEDLTAKRLESGETPDFTVGKYLERLMTLHTTKSPLFHHVLETAEADFKAAMPVIDTPMTILQNTGRGLNSTPYCDLLTNLLAAIGGRDKVQTVLYSNKVHKPYFIGKTLRDVLTLSHFSVKKGTGNIQRAFEHIVSQGVSARTLVIVTDCLDTVCEKTFEPVVKEYLAMMPPNIKVYLVSMYVSPSQRGYGRGDDFAVEETALYKSLRKCGVNVHVVEPTDFKKPDPGILDKMVKFLGVTTPVHRTCQSIVAALVNRCDLREIRDICEVYPLHGRESIVTFFERGLGLLFKSDSLVEHSKWTSKPTDADFEVFSNILEKCVSQGVISNANPASFKRCIEARDATGVLEEVRSWCVASLRDGVEPAARNYIKLNNDALCSVFQFLDNDSLRVVADTCRSWRYQSLSSAFEQYGTSDPKYKAELKQMKMFGFLRKYGYSECLSALRLRHGDVEAAVDHLAIGAEQTIDHWADVSY